MLGIQGSVRTEELVVEYYASETRGKPSRWLLRRRAMEEITVHTNGENGLGSVMDACDATRLTRDSVSRASTNMMTARYMVGKLLG